MHRLADYFKKQMLKVMFLLKNLFLQKKYEVKDFSGQKRIAIGQNSTGAKLYFLMKAFFRTNNHRRTNKIWRRKHEKYNRDCINSKVKHPLSIQVWGAISYYGKSHLKMVNGNLNSIKYQTEILGDIKLKCD